MQTMFHPRPSVLFEAPTGLSTRTPPELDSVVRTPANVGLWSRTIPHDLHTWLRTRTSGPERVVTSLEGNVDHVVRTFLDKHDAPFFAEAWARDIRELSELFLALSGAGSCRVSLARVHSDKCRKWHADYMGLRMICTYVGPGTQWVDDAHVQRLHLGCDETDIHRANRAIVPTIAPWHEAPEAAALLLKGENFPGNTGRGVVHRSPPIEMDGRSRIVLTIDEATAHA